MLDICKCLIAFDILVDIFYIWGYLFSKIFNLGKRHSMEKILIGFFLYFAIFQCFSLPMILLQKEFSSLVIIWLIAMPIITVLAWIYCSKSYNSINNDFVETLKSDVKDGLAVFITKEKRIKLFNICLMLFFIIAAGIILIQPYLGLDTSYYVGVMNEAIQSNRMYSNNVYTGTWSKGAMPIKYALNGSFFMQFALISKLLVIKPLVTAYYLMRGLGYFLSAGIVFLLGKEWFDEDNDKALLMSALYVFCNFAWNTYLATDFFILRLYEGKGYCQFVVLIMMVYCLVRIWKNIESETKNDNQMWLILFLVGLASVPVSVSSLLTYPALVGIVSVAMFIIAKQKKQILINSIICVLPNAVYFIIYFLASTNHLSIYIR